MGTYVRVYAYNKYDLMNNIMKLVRFVDKRKWNMLEEILDSFGATIGEKYILLNNEFWDECDDYNQIVECIAELFNLDALDVFDGGEQLNKDEEAFYVIERLREKYGKEDFSN